MENVNRRRDLILPGVRIAGSGMFLPGRPISNDEIIKKSGINTTDAWIRENLGIKSRHFAEEGQGASILGAEAAKLALLDAGISAPDLDRIIFCSSSADWTSPASACNVQKIIGADCPSEDKQNACAGFMYGLEHGARLISSGMKYVLVIGADVKSRFTDPTDLRFLPIFADGAGAFVLTDCSPDFGILYCRLWSDGAGLRNLYTPAGGSEMPASSETAEKGLHYVKMNVDGRIIFNDAVRVMTELSLQVLSEAGCSAEDVDVFIPHQANLLIMKAVCSNLKIPSEKMIVTLSETANIVTGTLPYSYDSAKRNGKISKGNLVLFVTAGAGYSAGAALYREI